jgi:hydrogenase maturation protease
VDRGRTGTLIVGAGNVLLSDEGLGVHVARALLDEPNVLPRGTDVVEAGTALLDVLPDAREYERVIVVDAVRAGGTPGTIYWFDLRDELNRRDTRSPHCLSLHEWSLVDSLRVAATLGWLPEDIRLLGAEPAALRDGLELSPVLAVAMRRMVALLRSSPLCLASQGP